MELQDFTFGSLSKDAQIFSPEEIQLLIAGTGVKMEDKVSVGLAAFNQLQNLASGKELTMTRGYVIRHNDFDSHTMLLLHNTVPIKLVSVESFQEEDWKPILST